MAALNNEYPAFRRAAFISVTVHIVLFLLILFSPHFPKPGRKDMVHYVNVVSFGGGGGGSSRSPAETKSLAETEVPTKESLKDLAASSSLEQQSSSFRYPVDKAKKEKKPAEDKKRAIQKPRPDTIKKKTSSKASSDSQGGTGSGIKIGVGEGTGEGSGSAYSSQIGLSTFPYTFYLQNLHDRISSNWNKALISPGISGNFHVTVSFKIFRNGNISTVEVLERSGIRSLDLSAIRAVQYAAPFPPLPYDYEDDYLVIRLIFEHNR